MVPPDYHIKVKTDDELITLGVGKKYYESVDIGDEINVDEYDGALGIAYVKLEKK